MTQDEQELLEKQLRAAAVAPRDDGVLMLVIAAVFFAGMALGGFLFAYNGQPRRTRSACRRAGAAAADRALTPAGEDCPTLPVRW
jgi:hypothetical protein